MTALELKLNHGQVLLWCGKFTRCSSVLLSFQFCTACHYPQINGRRFTFFVDQGALLG